MELDTDELERAEPMHRLRIAAAGVWHNVLVFLGTYILMLLLPRTYCWQRWLEKSSVMSPQLIALFLSGSVLLAPVYSHGSGLAVVSVAQRSPLTEALKVGDVITAVGV